MPRMLLFLPLLIMLGGCGILPEKPPAQISYRLEPRLPETRVPPAPRPLTLQVLEPSALASYATELIAYRQAPYRIDYYTQSRWAEPPSKMLGTLIARAVEESGLYRVVLGPAARLPADLRLASELIALEHVVYDTSQTQGSTVRLAMRVQLIDVKRAQVLASQSFEIMQPAFSHDAVGAVTAANAAVGEALISIIAFLREHTDR